MSTWGLNDIHSAVDHDAISDQLSEYTNDDVKELGEVIYFLPLKKPTPSIVPIQPGATPPNEPNETEPLKRLETHSMPMGPRVVAISQQEQDVYDNIISKHNAINGYLPEITENMKLLETVGKQNMIKINNMRIEAIKKINDRFNELIKENDSEVLEKQNHLNIHHNELKQHQDELLHLKLTYNSYISDEEMTAKQRKCKILEMNDDVLLKYIGPTTVIPKVKISFDKDVMFRSIDRMGGVRNYSSPNPPIFSIKHISASSATLQFENMRDSFEATLEIAVYYDIGDDAEEKEVKLEWQEIRHYSMNDQKECNVTKLKDDTVYSLRARYKNRFGLSEYSEIKTFKTFSRKILNEKLMHQYSRSNELQSQLNDEYDHIDIDSELKESELESVSAIKSVSCLKLGDENPSGAASFVSLQYKIKGGALTIGISKGYTMRIYLHYWLWQIPMLILNIILLCIWLSTDDIITQLGFIAVGPVFLAALIRDKLFIWFIYWAVQHLCCLCCCGQSIRYQFSRLADCIGGLHSSLGLTALAWNMIYFVDILADENYKGNAKTVTAGSLPLLLFVICLSAAPCFRYYYHNSFEVIHRYLNWLSLCFLLIHIYFVNRDQMILYATIRSPTILAAMLAILTIYPWLIIHRLKAENIEVIPSNTGTSTAFIFPIRSPMGAVCKLSLNWSEFHVFGITPLPYDKDKGHRSLVLIKDLGDWTKDLTSKAKNGELDGTLFWIHRIKPPNFSRGLFNFKKVFALATGAGIAPLIPYVVNTTYFDVQISLVWVARDHINNYPEFIVNIVKPLPNVILYDTTKQPRTDLSLLTLQKANEFNAEAVFIVSNPKLAYDVANYVNKKGIPIFASNFDV